MIIPISPFKFVSFSDSEHLIVFLDNEKFEAIEYIKYRKGPSGAGIEVILTEKDKSQIILTDSEKILNNLKLCKTRVRKCKIIYKKDEKNKLIKINLKCFTNELNIYLDFESMFPVSDFRKGIVDPKRHSNVGLPFMYTSQNTVGSKCNVIINNKVIGVLKSTDEMLINFNIPQAYYSNNFYLSVLQLSNKELSILSEEDNNYIYKSGENQNISFNVHDSSCVLKNSNYVEEYDDIIKFINNNNKQLLIENYSICFDKEKILSANFNPPINVINNGNDLEQCGIMVLSIIEERAKFECKYKVNHKVLEQNDKEVKIKSHYYISYSNELWDEKQREIKCTVDLFIDIEKNIVSKYIVRFIGVNSK